jgi:prepilin-type N-terminal cleavage/methylation domain-containing protein
MTIIAVTPDKPSGAVTMFAERGFTLVEIILVIVAIGIIAVVGIPRIGGLISDSRETVTKAELLELKKAIVGNSQLVSGNSLVSRGFEGDVGFAPSRLEDLAVKPDSVPVWDRIQRLGWHGPYIDTADSDYLTDAWGATYAYDGSARTITSIGSGSAISISF